MRPNTYIQKFNAGSGRHIHLGKVLIGILKNMATSIRAARMSAL